MDKFLKKSQEKSLEESMKSFSESNWCRIFNGIILVEIFLMYSLGKFLEQCLMKNSCRSSWENLWRNLKRNLWKNYRSNVWRPRTNSWINYGRILRGLSWQFLGVNHVTIFLVVILREFLEIFFKESLDKFVSCRRPGGIPNAIPEGILGWIPGVIRGRIPKHISGIIPRRISRELLDCL